MATQRNFEIKNGLSVAGTERIASNGDITGNHLGTFGGTTVTRSAGTNNTQLASTAYVDVAITNLIDSSPGALNTLNELAAALGDDASFSTTVTNSIATKAALAGAAFTGQVSITSGNGDQLLLNNAGERFTQISLQENGTTRGALWVDGTDNFVDLYANASHGIRFKTGGDNTRVTIDSSGNATFAGTINSGRIQPNEHIIFQSATGYLQFPGASSRAWALASQGGTASPGTNSATFGFHHWSGSAWSNPINITASGKLGVGTDNPDTELHVFNSSSGATATGNTVATFESNDNTEVSILGGSSSVLALNFGHSGDNNEGLLYFNTTNGSENMQLESSKHITFRAGAANVANNIYFKAYNTDVMTIDGSNNRVGIGTSPSSPLTVKPLGSIGDGANIADFIGSDTNQRLLVANFLCGSDEDRVGLYWENQGTANMRMWMDDTQDLRLKSSNPTHDHDGKRLVTESYSSGTSGGFLEQVRPYIGNVASATGDIEGGSNKGGTQIWIFQIQGDNTWRKVLTNMHDMTFEFYTAVGDAGSRDQASYSVNVTSPAYGVSSFNQNYYHNGGWNTGTFEYRYVNTPSNSSQYDLECRFDSYYSSSNNATGYIHLRRLY